MNRIIMCAILVLIGAATPALAFRGGGFGGAGGFHGGGFGGFHGGAYGGFHGGDFGHRGGSAAVMRGPAGGVAAVGHGPAGGVYGAARGPYGGWHAGGVGAYGGTWHTDGYHAGGYYADGFHGPAVVNSYYANGCYACSGGWGAAAAGAAAGLATGAAIGARQPPALRRDSRQARRLGRPRPTAWARRWPLFPRAAAPSKSSERPLTTNVARPGYVPITAITDCTIA